MGVGTLRAALPLLIGSRTGRSGDIQQVVGDRKSRQLTNSPVNHQSIWSTLGGGTNALTAVLISLCDQVNLS